MTSHHAAHRASELPHHLLLLLRLLRLSAHASHRASKLTHRRLRLVELALGLTSELRHLGLHLRLTSHHAAHRASELPHWLRLCYRLAVEPHDI